MGFSRYWISINLIYQIDDWILLQRVVLFIHIYFPIHLKPNTKHVILQCYVTKHGNTLIRPQFLFRPRFFRGELLRLWFWGWVTLWVLIHDSNNDPQKIKKVQFFIESSMESYNC